jgi:outer membrane biosynthesis protein TonB
MTPDFKRAGLIAAVSALIGAAACGNDTAPMDDSLKQDLAVVAGSAVELAPKAQSQMVISAIEAGPSAAPATATRKTAPKTVARAVAVPKIATAEAPKPSPEPEQRAVSAPTRAAEPAPLPPSTRAPAQRQPGTYKTEAEIFRQMPWIKP